MSTEFTTEPQYELTDEGRAIVAAWKARKAAADEPCGECDFCVCVEVGDEAG